MDKNYVIQCAFTGVHHEKGLERKCAHSSVSEKRRFWTTMDRSLRELFLVEVRLPTSSGKAIFCLSSTFR